MIVINLLLCVMAWWWTVRAGIKIAAWAKSGSTFAKRVAIGNSVVSLIPFAVLVFINQPH